MLTEPEPWGVFYALIGTSQQWGHEVIVMSQSFAALTSDHSWQLCLGLLFKTFFDPYCSCCFVSIADDMHFSCPLKDLIVNVLLPLGTCRGEMQGVIVMSVITAMSPFIGHQRPMSLSRRGPPDELLYISGPPHTRLRDTLAPSATNLNESRAVHIHTHTHTPQHALWWW